MTHSISICVMCVLLGTDWTDKPAIGMALVQVFLMMCILIYNYLINLMPCLGLVTGVFRFCTVRR